MTRSVLLLQVFTSDSLKMIGQKVNRRIPANSKYFMLINVKWALTRIEGPLPDRMRSWTLNKAWLRNERFPKCERFSPLQRYLIMLYKRYSAVKTSWSYPLLCLHSCCIDISWNILKIEENVKFYIVNYGMGVGYWDIISYHL